MILAAHLFWDCAPHLVRRMAVKYAGILPGSVVYMRDIGRVRFNAECDKDNQEWISKLDKRTYRGYLKRSWWMGRCGNRVGFLLSLFLPEFSMGSFCKLVIGPRNLILHGINFRLGTLIWLVLFGKRVVLIHWGGCVELPDVTSVKRRLFLWGTKLSYRLLRKVFVLMEPERRYFTPMIEAEKVAVLSYTEPMPEETMCSTAANADTRSLILGNSCWSMDDYEHVLDKLPATGWNKIVCMLNYGRERDLLRVPAFVDKYNKKFGQAFFPWRNVLPYDQYLDVVGSAPYYFSPCATQCGLGIIYQSIRQGKTLFLCGDNLEWMRYLGVCARDLTELMDFSYEGISKLALTSKEVRKSQLALMKHFNEINTDDFWRREVISAFKVR